MEEDSAHVQITVGMTMTVAAALSGFVRLVVPVAAMPILRMAMSVGVARLTPVRSLVGVLLEQRRVLGRHGIARIAILISIAVRSRLRIHRI